MERGSDKHGPMLDDQLKEETEPLERGAPVSSRVEEFRQMEDVDAGEASPGARAETPPPDEGGEPPSEEAPRS